MALKKLQSESSLADGLQILEADLDRAESAHIIEPLAESGKRFLASEAGRAYLPVLRDRLFRLGYLRVRAGPEGPDEPLERAIRRLQEEAGLTVDGWIGTQTWDGLQELFAFEPMTQLERWIGAKGMTPALRRAACLRLICLGFLPSQTRASLAPLEEPLSRWRRTLVLLKAPGISDDTSFNSLDLIEYLFNIDRLSRLVGGAGGDIRRRIDGPPSKDGEMLRRFLNCLLKIELWLLGYEKVSPDGKPLDISRTEHKVRRRQGRRRVRTVVQIKYSRFYQVIRDFWADTGASDEHGSEAEILLRSFREIVDMDEGELNERQERIERTTGLIEQIDQDQAEVGEHWSEAGFAGRVWDGVKRVWRFLKRLVRGAAKRIKLLVRGAYQLAAEGFTLVRRGIRIFSEGLTMLFSPEIKGSNEQIAMRHRADFDFEVFLDAQATERVTAEFLEALHRRLASLRAALRVLGLLFHAAMTAARLATGPWGWWRLLRALMHLNSLYDEEDREIVAAALGA